MNRSKLKNILDILSPDGTSADFSSFDESVAKLKEGLKGKIEADSLQEMKKQIEKFKKTLDFAPLQKSISDIEKTLDEKIKRASVLVDNELSVFSSTLRSDRLDLTDVTLNVERLKTELGKLKEQAAEIAVIKERLNKLPEFVKRIEGMFVTLQETIDSKDEMDGQNTVEYFNSEMEKTRRELNNRINNLSGGGNANRNIAVGGNTSVLSTFTDINLKAGSNVTITYAKNQTTKYTDITIAATGGGGGTVRSINSIAIDTTAGATAGTDYVYLISGTTTLTMPTTVANTNLYTVKNIGAGTVTIITTGGETIDGSANLIMPTQFTSVDLISNNSGDWAIT